jgi:signal transduction histidine kinase
MLHEFLSANRNELIERCREKVIARRGPGPDEERIEHGIPKFIGQLIRTLEIERTAHPMQSRLVSGPADGGKAESALSEIGKAAEIHGRELHQQGFTIEQVVHDYGDLCQSITDLAFERGAPIEVDEFRTLNRCLDNGIAGAVMEFNSEREARAADRQGDAINQRLGFFAHELRNLLQTLTLAIAAIRSGNVGVSGATGAVLDRTLIAFRTLIDRSLTTVRLKAGVPPIRDLFSLASFIADIELSASLEARVKGCELTVAAVDPRLAVDADLDLLSSAVCNILQNAFKFTRPGTEVILRAHESAGRILIDVEDRCGGLPPGDSSRLFAPFTRARTDRPGLGLGLSISKESVEANSGRLRVRDLPGTGCVFTIDLPRREASFPIPVTEAAAS